jgi:hypothetical protein
MKKLRYLLVFLIWGTACFSQDSEKLSAKPWEDIVEMNSFQDSPLIREKWYTAIKVKLVGLF